MPTGGIPTDATEVFTALKARPSFLMVGTLEPRKGHAQSLAAFELLWRDNIDVNLVIVGKQGWMVELIVPLLRSHREFGKRLFWLDGISDEYLEKIYVSSTCLIAASEGEGFGLPLIEAAQHSLPILARDIPVFREVAGAHAYFFEESRAPDAMASAIKDWLQLFRAGSHPRSESMPRMTWRLSAKQLLGALSATEPYKRWGPSKGQHASGLEARAPTPAGTHLE
jgi:glycosyltransferase involved in cell wall biosynthesis